MGMFDSLACVTHCHLDGVGRWLIVGWICFWKPEMCITGPELRVLAHMCNREVYVSWIQTGQSNSEEAGLLVICGVGFALVNGYGYVASVNANYLSIFEHTITSNLSIRF
jgi:hypothetical protein